MWLPETLRLYFFFFFFHGKLVLSVAVSTPDRQASQLAAILQAEDRPMFKGLKSDSTARNHVCLGRPTGRLQCGGGFRIAAETVRLPGYYY